MQVSLCRIYNAIQQDGCHLPQADLGIATVSSDLWPVEKVRKAARTVLQEDTESALHYCMSPGNRILREQISLLSMKSGFSVAPEEIVITSGCMEGVYLALNRLCRPGDTVAIETPIFSASSS